jgi:aspartyl-tRNA(Asn)/glutamyl-tRNA(Gln) amidotransferase subunit B
MRTKEHAHDYRYFPEPDLVPLRVSEARLERIREALPELPADKRHRFVADYGLREYDARVLTATPAISDYFEKALEVAGDPVRTANWITAELMGLADGFDRITPQGTGTLVRKMREGEISGKMAKDIFTKMYETGLSADAVIEREGLRQISDTGALETLIAEVIAANPKQLEQYKSGKTAVLGYFVGQVMKASKRQANPAAVNELLKAKLQ